MFYSSVNTLFINSQNLKKCLVLVIDWLIFLLCLLPICLPVIGTLLISKLIVIGLSRIFRPDLLQPISGLDNFFSVDDFWGRPKGATSFIWILDGESDPTAIKERFTNVLTTNNLSKQKELNVEDTLYDYSRLMSLTIEVWLGYSFWKKSVLPFSMDNHLKIVKEPPQGFRSLIHLNKFLANCMRSGFEKGLPLWQLIVIPSVHFQDVQNVPNIRNETTFLHSTDSTEEKKGLRSRSVVLLKIHHLIGDGYSKLRLLERIVDTAKEDKEDAKEFPSAQIPSSLSSLIKEHQSSIKNPDLNAGNILDKKPKKKMNSGKVDDAIYPIVQRLESVQNTFHNLLLFPSALKKLIRDFVFHSDVLTEMKPDSEIFLSTTQIHMKQLKEIRKKLVIKYGKDISLIAVAVSALAGALRRSLVQNRKQQLPLWTNFVIALPLTLKHHPGQSSFNNYWTHGIVNVRMDEEDSLQRLLSLNDNFQKMLNARWPLIFHSFIVPLQSLLPYFICKWITLFNMGVPNGSTNMVGPSTKVFLAGREVIHKYAYVGLLWTHSSMTGAFFSYNGMMSATLVVNRNVVSSAETADQIMNTFLQQEINQLSHQCT